MNELDYKQYAKKAREVCADSCVLIKNDNNTLPIKSGEVISVFGRIAFETYYSGTGSGGMVNLPYVVNLIDGIKAQREVNADLVGIYTEWIKDHPFDNGEGWAQGLWSQEDMQLSEKIVKDAREISQTAIYVIGRTAGEDQDSKAEAGSYYLTSTEEENIRLITQSFQRVVVVLNVGNVIDMTFVSKHNPSAVMYAWHGGSESGNGYADVLTGKVNPSGKLTDTIVYELEASPTNMNFGNLDKNIYCEDIFVGYRYFETFAKHEAKYPFGFGLSYTDFAVSNQTIKKSENGYQITAKVENVGRVAGKTAVQCYVKAPCGKLGKSSKALVGFAKTKVLEKGESTTVSIKFEDKYISSYDADGKTGNESCFVIEKGEYLFYLGFDVRDENSVSKLQIDEDIVVETCSKQCAPTEEFEIFTAKEVDNQIVQCFEKVNTAQKTMTQRMIEERKSVSTQTFNGYTFEDYKNGKITAFELALELSDLDLICMTRGEGMCSPKVTSGTAGCFGGVTDVLFDKKIPIACCSDGPSGLRLDTGAMAFSIPNGTAIASTFDETLTCELFEFFALEMLKNKVDTVLGPGMNIHRSPLCGRNFEYFSEDPVLSGKIASAQLSGLHKYGVTGTIKHFACNNQENQRKVVDSVLSERALREIYLRGFEIAVKEGGAYSIMTSYNPINGVQAASNFDICTSILRGEWGYDGVVMTDWWAEMNLQGEKSAESETRAMILAQNDVYMVNGNAQENSNKDNSQEMLEKGELCRYELVRGGENIIKTLARFNCADGHKKSESLKVVNTPIKDGELLVDMGTVVVDEVAVLPLEGIKTQRGATAQYVLQTKTAGKYQIEFDLESEATELSQVPLTIKASGTHLGTIALKGTSKRSATVEFTTQTSINIYIDLFFGLSGMKINSAVVRKI